MPHLTHPDLPGRTVHADPKRAAVMAASGWVETDPTDPPQLIDATGGDADVPNGDVTSATDQES